MRQRAIISALLLIGVGVVLGTTVFRADIAQATGLAQSVTVNNTAAQAVPVREQNLDGSNIRVHEEGTAAVHEQGTADVNVTNSSLTVAPQSPVTDGGSFFQGTGGQTWTFADTVTASALMVTFTSGAFSLDLTLDGHVVAFFFGPASVTGNRSYQLALSRPVSFDGGHCSGPATETCGISWVGNKS